MTPLFSIIIPSWNNNEFLFPCVESIARTGVLSGIGELIIVNNGDYPLAEYFKDLPNTKVIDAGENLGWERGLIRGMDEAKGKYLCFQNDDTVIPSANSNFYMHLLYPFADPDIAAVGPATTIASGWHSVFQHSLAAVTEVPYLIFFTVMVDREYLMAAGGIDASAPGGDDFDCSIRLRKLGKRLVINPSAFIIHHGFKSGTRLKGDHTRADGWNSKEMQEKTNQWLIQKHGFKAFLGTMLGQVAKPEGDSRDTEGDCIRAMVQPGQDVYEFGCGGQKTVPWAIGVDRVPKGELIPHVGQTSVADITCDVSQPLPIKDGSADVIICRHILEHCVDLVSTLNDWKRVLREGGTLILAVPDEAHGHGIPMNPEHVHAFTKESLSNLLTAVGFFTHSTIDPENKVSLVGVFKKPSMGSKTTSDAREACLA